MNVTTGGEGRIPDNVHPFVDGRLSPRRGKALGAQFSRSEAEWARACKEQNAALRELFAIETPDERGAEIAIAAMRFKSALSRAIWIRRAVVAGAVAFAFVGAWHFGGAGWTGGQTVIVRPIDPALFGPPAEVELAAEAPTLAEETAVAAAERDRPAPSPLVSVGPFAKGEPGGVAEPAPAEDAIASSPMGDESRSPIRAVGAAAPREPTADAPFVIADVVWPPQGSATVERAAPVALPSDRHAGTVALRIDPPDFSPLGYELLETRSHHGANGVVNEFTYADARSRQVMLMVYSREAGSDTATWVRVQDGQSSMLWRVGPYHFGLSGQISPTDVAHAARLVHDALSVETSADGSTEPERFRSGLQPIDLSEGDRF